MATHSSIHAWRTPWTEKPGGGQFMGLQGVGHDWRDSAHSESFPTVTPVKYNIPTHSHAHHK